MENECEALPGVAYPGVRANRITLNTKTGYNDDDDHWISIAPDGHNSEAPVVGPIIIQWKPGWTKSFKTGFTVFTN